MNVFLLFSSLPPRFPSFGISGSGGGGSHLIFHFLSLLLLLFPRRSIVRERKRERGRQNSISSSLSLASHPFLPPPQAIHSFALVRENAKEREEGGGEGEVRRGAIEEGKGCKVVVALRARPEEEE
jgi:hypothetical protein